METLQSTEMYFKKVHTKKTSDNILKVKTKKIKACTETY